MKVSLLQFDIKREDVGENLCRMEKIIGEISDTDLVINIVVDHRNQELSTDIATLDFETAIYTGLAIDIE